MKLPHNFSLASIEINIFDCGADDLTLKATSDGDGEAYLEMKTSPTGVVLERGDLHGIADLGEALLDLFEELNSEAPDAGDKPATGITPTAEKGPLI